MQKLNNTLSNKTAALYNLVDFVSHYNVEFLLSDKDKALDLKKIFLVV